MMRPKTRRRRLLRALRKKRWTVHRHGRFDTPHGTVVWHKIPKRKKGTR